MRLRLPELLDARGWTAYQLSVASQGRISMSTAYRIVRQNGSVKCFDAALLEDLCDVLDLEPGELFERESKKKGHRARVRAASQAVIKENARTLRKLAE
jgi:DNA-binding Xre family transcriptional regulator